MRLRALALIVLTLLLAGACVGEVDHCLNPQPDLPSCSNRGVPAGGGASPSSNSPDSGVAGNLAIENPPVVGGAGGAASSAGGSPAQDAEGGASGDSGAAGEAGNAALVH